MAEFTVERANRALPLVRRIVEDVVRSYARWADKVREFELAAAVRRADRPDPGADALEAELNRLAEEVERFKAELEQLGVRLTEPQIGLVDFPSSRDGRPIYLCWRLGEPTVQFWHERDAGYRGRQPIAPEAAA